jgi:hypothetical protein
VGVKAVFLGETGVADDAEIRPVASVDTAVAVEMRGLRKPLVTNMARVGLFTCKQQ